jgi:hypothetical protein
MIDDSIETPADALLFCDYLAKFGYAGIARVIRDLMFRLEQQALVKERAEAANGGAQ